MLTEGLERLGIVVPAEVETRALAFLDEMLRWNQHINLTAIKDRTEATEVHLLDSLVLCRYLTGTESLLDMGSGAGLPGIVLAIAQPNLSVVSVESTGKKINFQKHIKRRLKIDNLEIIQERIEKLKTVLPNLPGFDVVTARAFASMDKLLELGMPWLKKRGRLLAMKGPEGHSELCQVRKLIDQKGWVVSLHEYQLPASGAERLLIVVEK